MKPILNMKAYNIVRTTAIDPVVGRAVPGVETTIPIKANLQPVGKTLSSLPEARRSEDLRRFFTATEIYMPGQVVSGVTYNADQIVIKGARYEVFKVDEWNVDHFECFAARQDTP